MELPVTLPTSSPQFPPPPPAGMNSQQVPRPAGGPGGSGLAVLRPHWSAQCSPFWLGRELHPGKPALSQKSDGVRRHRCQRRQAPLGLALRLLQATQRPLPRYSEEPRMQGLGLPAVSSVTSVPAGHSKNSIGDDR